MSRKSQQNKNIAIPVPAPVKSRQKIKPVPKTGMGTWLLVFAAILPFLFSRATNDPVIPVRFIFFSLFVFCFTAYFILFKKAGTLIGITMPVKAVFITGILFGAWSCLAATASYNISVSFYEILKHFLLLSFLVIALFVFLNEPVAISFVCRALVLVAIGQGMVGILQYYELAFTDLPGANNLPYGLMANRNLFGSALAFLLPFLLYHLYQARGFWRIAGIIGLFIEVYALLLSQTRSAWLASLAILAGSFILIMFFKKTTAKKWILAYITGFIAMIVIVAMVLWADTEGQLRNEVAGRVSYFVQSSPDSANVPKIFNTVASDASERVRIWKKTILLIKDHPIRGVGPANWKLKIPEYGSKGLKWELGKWVPDRVHNVYLQITAETGIVGSLLYFGMWILVAILGFFSLRKSNEEGANYLSVLMLCGLGALAIDCMFSFPLERIEHSLLVYLMAAILLANYVRVRKKTNTLFLSYSFSIPIIILSLLCFYMGLKKFKFEKQLVLAKAYQDAGKYNEAIDAAAEGQNDFATINEEGKSLQVYSSLAYQELKKYPEALKEANTALKYNPNSAMVFNNIGTIYTHMGRFEEAYLNYNRALQLKPKFDEALKNQSLCYFNLKKYDSCILMLQQVDYNKDAFLLNIMNQAKNLTDTPVVSTRK